MSHVIGNVIHGVGDAVALFDQLGGAVHDRERAQAEKINLKQTDRFDDFHGPLGDAVDATQPFVAAGRAVEGHIFVQGPIGNDDARRMAGSVAGDPFETLGGIE